MSAPGWSRRVFRLRRVPDGISSAAAVASLLSGVLDVPSDHVVVHSVARAAEIFEVPSRTATLQLKSVPKCLQQALADNEWSFPIAGGGPTDVLVLDTHFEGITILSDTPPSQHRADCIAISGLASHPFGSWQPHGGDKTFMWIRDAISTALPGVRTAIYGYDSKLADSRSFQSISDIARGLILHLKSAGWNRPSSKPIVFLAHSLGGLVLKDAIVQMADRVDASVSSILNNVSGAIMFGVPSLGMEQSHLMAMVEGRPNESLVQDLSRDGGSNYVRQLNARFEALSFLRKAKILWAYETEESPTGRELTADGSWKRCDRGPYAVLVNRDSATSNHYRKDKSVTIPIQKDHSNMVKFSRGDTSLAIITSSIAEILAAVQFASSGDPAGGRGVGTGSLATEEPLGYGSNVGRIYGDYPSLTELDDILSELEELHAELFSTELNFRIESIDDPFEDTFNWVFDLPVFRQWLQEGSGLFWIHGKPGSGKSTLMKLIFQHGQTWELLHNWQRNSLEVFAGFFFHYRGSAIQKSFEGLLRSLVLQILAPIRDPYLKRYEPTWRRYQTMKARLSVQSQKLAHAKWLLSNATQELNQVEEELGRFHSMQSGAQNGFPPTDFLQHIRSEEFKHRDLSAGIERHRADVKRAEAEVASICVDLTKWEDQHAGTPFSSETATKFLKDVATSFRSHRNSDNLIPRLERILQQLLDQTTIEMELVLFFDALDEFGGHLDMISRFMKTLLKISPTSKTRAKVCMSSRPWETLKAHFASYPGFAVQDYTAHDMEQYAVGSVSAFPDTTVLRLVPTILERANGVFLWVKLAVKFLLETAVLPPESGSVASLEERLRDLPDDLFEFYELIVERISKRNRRYTFALLELLLRHKGPPAEAYQVRDAVLTSGCKTFSEAAYILGQPPQSSAAVQDIQDWSGGLVEVKSQDGVLRPQLMHQTVLEFTMGLWFKKMVIGDLASILHENGHSFHVKYWLTARALRHQNALIPAESSLDPLVPLGFNTRKRPGRPWVSSRAPSNRVLNYDSKEKLELEIFAFHIEQSELTTGKSQYEFLRGVPYEKLGLFSKLYTGNYSWNADSCLLSFAASFNLTLCLRDWKEGHGEIWMGRHLESWPLLSSLVFFPPAGAYHARYLTTARLIFATGFSMTQDPLFFPRLVAEFWVAKSSVVDHDPERAANSIPASDLLALAKLVLDHGQDPNVGIEIFLGVTNGITCTPLHLATPQLAAELIRHGANPQAGLTRVNMPVRNGPDPRPEDSLHRQPLHWILQHPQELAEEDCLSCAERYEMCNLLVHAVGVPIKISIPFLGVEATLAEFEGEGYDTSRLGPALRAPSYRTPGPQGLRNMGKEWYDKLRQYRKR
ncbi:hypothetical protein B0T16DRAFT_235197 [Cercophora newfieldiana]|uniref:Nephrocystin 3-like N-terminal domain-containing protein n=1 Tax=Cercophora newfieldiana TaxID=92897 RepID=A0AA40CJ10_9PEZI|nr:hypothetical protein B0T16DRAFT_235197 [Cercophora newfieldiana]